MSSGKGPSKDSSEDDSSPSDSQAQPRRFESITRDESDESAAPAAPTGTVRRNRPPGIQTGTPSTVYGRFRLAKVSCHCQLNGWGNRVDRLIQHGGRATVRWPANANTRLELSRPTECCVVDPQSTHLARAKSPTRHAQDLPANLCATHASSQRPRVFGR